MLQELGGSNLATAEAEITRYLGWPAQAISYKIGRRTILSLREEFREKFGDDLREVHRRVLGCGNVDLGLLRSLVLDPDHALNGAVGSA
jgi:uncharacterized protein (DUF885 family)